MKFAKIMLFLFLISGFGFLCYFLLIFFELIWVYNMVIPLTGTIEKWIPGFQEFATYGIIVAWISALLWYVLAQWVFKVNKFSNAGKRLVWGLFTLLALLPAVVFSIIQSIESPLQEGFVIPPLIYLLNFIIAFYVPTLLFSPSSFKYAPIPAKLVRRW